MRHRAQARHVRRRRRVDSAFAGVHGLANGLNPAGQSGRRPDFILEMPHQVHDFFEGNPAERERLWKGPKDSSAKVWLAREERGLRIRVEVEDDVHREPPEGASRSEGDCIEVSVAEQMASTPMT